MLKKCRLSILFGKTYLEFMKEVVTTIKSSPLETSLIDELINEFIKAVDQDQEAYDAMQKSCRRKEVLAADCARSSIINSINLITKAYEFDASDECVNSSKYMRHQLHRYDNHVNVRTYETSTMAIYNFLQEINSANTIKHVWNLRLGLWIDKLERANKRVSNLIFSNGCEGVHNSRTFSETRRYCDQHFELLINAIETVCDLSKENCSYNLEEKLNKITEKFMALAK